MSYVVKETYAHLLAEYLSYVGATRPRFILLGFEDIRGQIRQRFDDKDVLVIEPEHSGRLKEASLLRSKSDRPCVILIGKKNLGKFASLVTAFKVLEEVVVADAISKRKMTDVHRLLDVSKWLIYERLGEVIEFIEEKVGKLDTRITYGGIEVVLKELWTLANEKPSFAEWLHPRRLLKGLVHAANAQHAGQVISLASFLRSMGIESKEKLENFALFDSLICKEENLKELRVSLVEYSQILRKYVTANITNQRRNLANLLMNHLRDMLYRLAKDELKTTGLGGWTEVFCDFEYAYSTRRRVIRKYRVESKGVRILRRSSVSGLPTCFRVPLEVNVEEEVGRNLLQEFSDGKMEEIVKKCSKISPLKFSLRSMTLAGQAKSLLVEFTLLHKNGNVVLDPLIEGLKSPTSRINRLFASIKGRGEE